MIHVLEDDRSIRELVVYSLNSVGLEARGFGLPSEFREAVQAAPPDLALLDIMLPEENGVALLQWLRANEATRHVPVILLTALGDEFDKVRGLDAGADDYVVKPFGIMELLARVRARLRGRATGRDDNAPPSRCGPLTLDRGRREARVNGLPVMLTRKEYDLLRLFMDNPRSVFDRERILQRVWGYDYAGETRTVDVHVRTLRHKLGEAAACIETVRGVGYRLAAQGEPERNAAANPHSDPVERDQ